MAAQDHISIIQEMLVNIIRHLLSPRLDKDKDKDYWLPWSCLQQQQHHISISNASNHRQPPYEEDDNNPKGRTKNLFTSTKLLKVLRDRNIGATGTCRKGSGILKEFVTKKNKDKKDEIPWNTLEMAPSEDNLVNYMAWKDNALCLFQSTINTGEKTVKTVRKRPSETSSTAKTLRVPFGDQATKKLQYPEFDYLYNHNMSAVDVADQLRSYNNGLRRIRKGGWHAMALYL